MNFDDLKNLMDRFTDWVIPGNSAVIYKDGKKVFEYGSGYSDLDAKTPMTADNLIYIYSCSKIATVTAALQLYERGYFLLDDPLYDFIPEFKDMYLKDGTKAKNPITMRHLFTMTSGLSYDSKTPAFDKAREITNGKMDTMSVIKCLAQDPLQFEPGTHFLYSLSHDVLAAVVEVISGKRFADYVIENIFAPLDMNTSFYHLDDENKKRLSKQYICDVEPGQDVVKLQAGSDSSGVVREAGYKNSLIFGDEYDSGGAGIITTVNDYALFTSALGNKGMGLNGNRILSSGTVELLKTNQLNSVLITDFDWIPNIGYGYGLGVKTMIDRALSGSNGSYGQFGWSGAAGATAIIDTDLNMSLFYAHHMLNPQEPYYKPRLRNVLYKCLD